MIPPEVPVVSDTQENYNLMFKNYFGVLLVIGIITFSCKTVKKTQGFQEAISKKDTAQTIVIKE